MISLAPHHGTRGFAVRPVGSPSDVVGVDAPELAGVRGAAPPESLERGALPPSVVRGADVLPRGCARPLVDSPPCV
jgi:hypothetical protein